MNFHLHKVNNTAGTKVLQSVALFESAQLGIHLIQHNMQYHGKVLLSSFYSIGYTLGFDHRSKSLNPFVQHEQYHRKVLLSSFQLNANALGFHSQIQKLEPLCTTAPQESTA